MGQENDSAAINIGDVLDTLGLDIQPTEQQIPEPPEESTVTDPPPDTTDTDSDDTASDDEAAPPQEPAESDDQQDEADDQTDEDDETDKPADESDDEEEEEPEPDEAEARSVKKLTKRVDKLTARAKSAEEQAQALQAELATAREALANAQPILLQDQADPLADVYTPQDLEQRINSANAVIDQVPDLIAKAEMEGGEIDVPISTGGTQKFTTAELRDRLQRAKSIVRNEPNRRAYFAQRQQALTEAKQVYPEFFQDGHNMRQIMLDTLRQAPYLARLPNLELIFGDAWLGQEVRRGALKVIPANGAKTSPPAKPAAKQSQQPVAAPKVPRPSAAPRAKAKPNALETLRHSGSREAAESFVAAILDD